MHGLSSRLSGTYTVHLNTDPSLARLRVSVDIFTLMVKNKLSKAPTKILKFSWDTNRQAGFFYEKKNNI